MSYNIELLETTIRAENLGWISLQKIQKTKKQLGMHHIGSTDHEFNIPITVLDSHRNDRDWSVVNLLFFCSENLSYETNKIYLHLQNPNPFQRIDSQL